MKKTCTKCLKEKDLDMFYERYDRNVSYRCSQCMRCQNQKRLERYYKSKLKS